MWLNVAWNTYRTSLVAWFQLFLATGDCLSGPLGLGVSILPEPSAWQYTFTAGLGLLPRVSSSFCREKSYFKVLQDPFHNQRSGYHNIIVAMLLFGCIEVCEINIGITASLKWATCDRHGSVGGWLPAMPTAVSVRKAKWILKRRTGSV